MVFFDFMLLIVPNLYLPFICQNCFNLYAIYKYLLNALGVGVPLVRSAEGECKRITHYFIIFDIQVLGF